jgi:segregation and condensation protein B
LIASLGKRQREDDGEDNESRRRGVARRCAIEALLFVAGEPLTIERLAILTKSTILDVAIALQDIEKAFAGRGIVLRHVAGGYRFATAPASRAVVEAYLPSSRSQLSRAAIETLAIIAYTQPTTKSKIAALRGVNIDGVIETLRERGLIVEAGRCFVPGQPMLYETTTAFLEAFGLQSITDLPSCEMGTLAEENPDTPGAIAYTRQPGDGDVCTENVAP